jgi:hypothetical protein
MDLSKILAVSGKPGLFKMLSQGKNNFIVESLTDGRRFPVFPHEKVSALEEISIFSAGEEDIPLKDIFRKIFEKEQGGPVHVVDQAPDRLKGYFETAVPEYDPSRVYVSDMKKVVTWYNLLLGKGMLAFPEEKPDEQGGSGETAMGPEPENIADDRSVTPARKAAKKKKE